MSVKNALIATLNMLKRMERKVVYKDKNNFLTKTLFSADELAVIAILKNKSKDKSSHLVKSLQILNQ